MATALEYAGYASKLVYGTGAHSYTHGGAIMPDTLRWIWVAPPSPAAAVVASKL